MKYIRLYLTALTAAMMAACSSMEVDDNELNSENFPKDFSDTVYMQLHPELRSIQVRNYVKERNARLKDSLSADAYQALYDSDTTAFYTDTAKLHEIFVDAQCLNFAEEDWSDIWMEIVSPDVECKQKYSFKEVFFLWIASRPMKMEISPLYTARKQLLRSLLKSSRLVKLSST